MRMAMMLKRAEGTSQSDKQFFVVDYTIVGLIAVQSVYCTECGR